MFLFFSHSALTQHTANTCAESYAEWKQLIFSKTMSKTVNENNFDNPVLYIDFYQPSKHFFS